MQQLCVSKKFELEPAKTKSVTNLMRMFGVGMDTLKNHQITHSCNIHVNDGDIVYITGPSGAGKSVLLNQLQACFPPQRRINIENIALSADKAAIDCIANKGIIDAMSLLSYAGLSDVFYMLTAPAYLSEGQKYRFRIASAFASGKKIIFADEFCSNLDRITAGVVAYNVRRFAKHNGVTFFLASSHEDILPDLQPDVIVTKRFGGETKVIYRQSKKEKGKINQ